MAKKKNPENKFKKLILTWWVWVIIAIVSYFIFAFIPIQWTGNGLEEVAGTGGLKTFFAYFTQISWIIAISLLIVSGIKYLQKTKMNDYWKISLTMLGIVLIIAYVFYSISSFGIFHQSNPDERVKEMLEEDGYDVIFNYYSEMSALNETWASVRMKSLGDINEQVWDALIVLGVHYKDATNYIITISTPTSECFYNINGNIYRAYRKASSEGRILVNGTEIDDLTLYNYIAIQIEEETKTCS